MACAPTAVMLPSSIVRVCEGRTESHRVWDSVCGIAAALPADPDFLDHALAAQASRGPDKTVSLDLEFCGIGVNRLAVSGLDGGDQPLSSDDGSVLVVFNGAIYNAPALIEGFDLHPRSANDGEVIPFLYDRFGLDFANHLDGMFAICIADMKRRKLVLAVDQIGIKPLYTCSQDGRLHVASVMNAFPADMRRSVSRVPPGLVVTSTGEMRRISPVCYTDADIGTLLASSVRDQIPREVAWGCMLSGGVDSSLITRLAVDVDPAVHTFTCGMPDSADLLAAREVAEVLGSSHHEIIADPGELPAVVDEVITATASMERWVITPAVGTYLAACRARQEGLTVLLSGEGADELFGGYDEFQDIPAEFLNSVLLHYQVDLGATECLRLDRSTMAHGIEARVPFLSTSVIRHARRLPPTEKIRVRPDGRTRKHALRKFARTVLPHSIADREKEGFAFGSGISSELRKIARSMFSMQDVADLRASFPSFPIREELSAWFFVRWLAIFGTSIGTDRQDLISRGLSQQQWSRYLPIGADSTLYSCP